MRIHILSQVSFEIVEELLENYFINSYELQ